MSAHDTVLAVATSTLVLLVSTVGARAQSLDKLKNTTPEQRAAVQTTLMTEKLGLTPEQKAKVADLNLVYAKKMQPIIESGRPLMAMREARQIGEEKEAALKKILSPEQFQKFLAGKEEMREKFEERIMSSKQAPNPER
jgi:hypothetical protein